MEGNNNSSLIAPFVMKTYQMVSDPTTDGLITWGSTNNSFVVIDSLAFSQRILPAFFKHNNFSSFVRQLNTYGFRKVDADRWEFANEWFLRGQKHLLNNIVRKKHNKSNYILQHKHEDDDDDKDEIRVEIERMKREQKALEQELENMNKRLEATERRPDQMMEFLYRVAEDPEILPRVLLKKERTKRLGDKKRRLMIATSSSSPSSGVEVTNSVKSEEEDLGDVGATIGAISSQTSPDCEATAWGQPQATSLTAVVGGFGTVLPPVNSVTGHYNVGGNMSYYGGMEGSPAPYPFSLFRGGL